MSTKIYGGLRLKDPSLDIYKVVSIIAPLIRAAFDVEAHNTVANLLAGAVDRADRRDGKDGKDDFYFAEERHWIEFQNKLGRHHTSNDPLRFSIVFGRSSEGNTLALAYSNNREYDRVLKETGLFEDYGYWDNVDQPDELTYEQWKARGKEWESLENEEGTFGDLLTWELGGTMDIWSRVFMGDDKDQNLNNYRSQRARLADSLIDALVGHFISEDPDKSNIFKHVFPASRAVKEFMKTPAAEEIPLPELLPTKFFVTFDELPPIYRVSDELLQTLIDFKAAQQID